MAIRADSYSTTSEVKAFTRHLLDGQSTFNSTTRPTMTELEKFIDRASGVLNVAIAKAGFTPAGIRGNSTAKLAADDWVTDRAAEYVEITQRGAGYSDGEGSRTATFHNLSKDADQFIAINTLGFIRLGVEQTIKQSSGLAFTGLDAQKDRPDRTNESLEQPFAERGQFNNKRAANFYNNTSV
jgi:hypothetical protein